MRRPLLGLLASWLLAGVLAGAASPALPDAVLGFDDLAPGQLTTQLQDRGGPGQGVVFGSPLDYGFTKTDGAAGPGQVKKFACDPPQVEASSAARSPGQVAALACGTEFASYGTFGVLPRWRTKLTAFVRVVSPGVNAGSFVLTAYDYRRSPIDTRSVDTAAGGGWQAVTVTASTPSIAYFALYWDRTESGGLEVRARRPHLRPAGGPAGAADLADAYRRLARRRRPPGRNGLGGLHDHALERLSRQRGARGHVAPPGDRRRLVQPEPGSRRHDDAAPQRARQPRVRWGHAGAESSLLPTLDRHSDTALGERRDESGQPLVPARRPAGLRLPARVRRSTALHADDDPDRPHGRSRLHAADLALGVGHTRSGGRDPRARELHAGVLGCLRGEALRAAGVGDVVQRQRPDGDGIESGLSDAAGEDHAAAGPGPDRGHRRRPSRPHDPR